MKRLLLKRSIIRQRRRSSPPRGASIRSSGLGFYDEDCVEDDVVFMLRETGAELPFDEVDHRNHSRTAVIEVYIGGFVLQFRTGVKASDAGDKAYARVDDDPRTVSGVFVRNEYARTRARPSGFIVEC